MDGFGNTILNEAAVENLFRQQLSFWPLAKANYEALDGVRLREVSLFHKLQFNPQRIVSSTANIDPEYLKKRHCFFCREYRPAEQKGIAYEGVATDYIVQVNPYPIFRRHLVIQSTAHTRQQINAGRFEDMLDLARTLKHYVVFYNGPHSGASVPDHFHFQAGIKGVLPLQANYENYPQRILCQRGSNAGENYKKVSVLDGYTKGAFVFEATGKKVAVELFDKIYRAFAQADKRYLEEGLYEPKMNVLCWWETLCGNDDFAGEKIKGFWRVAVMCRDALRPSCFFAEGDANILISPACVEMAGLFITPRQNDFERVGEADLQAILKEVSVSEEIQEKIIERLQ